MQPSALSTTVEPQPSRLAESVRKGLAEPGQKQLPPEYFYDEVGSALFEAITVLPEYGLTRADSRILERHANDIVRLAPAPAAVLELGSGSGTKTAHLLRSLAQRQGRVNYYPIDVSASALDACARDLSSTARVYPVRASFIEGVRTALSQVPDGHRALLLFLGSTIGNYDRRTARELIGQLRSALSWGDAMVIGFDLVKPVDQLLLAYDDPAGVTAAFNLNLLARLNRELGADFDLRLFAHQARYNPSEKRIEMHLIARREHVVNIPGAGCKVAFRHGESIWTESSHKYQLSDVARMAAEGGFRVVDTWTDQEWPFAESLWKAV
jgi:L-histidine N-alpha-methyltransferase